MREKGKLQIKLCACPFGAVKIILLLNIYPILLNTVVNACVVIVAVVVFINKTGIV